MSRRTPSLLVPALLVGALLVGCSDDDTPTVTDTPSETVDTGATTSAAPDDAADTSAPDTAAQTEAPEDGVVTAASGAFRLTLPADWVDVTADVEQEVEVAARAGEMTDGFYTNAIIDREDPISDLQESLEQAAQEIAGEDGSYEMLDEFEVAGENAVGYTVTRTVNDVEVQQTQRWIPHGDHLYVVTLSVAAGQTEAGEAVLQELFDGWEWLD